MTDLRETAQQALEALEERYVGALRDKAMDALRAALAQQEQEPVAWVDEASIAWLAEHPRGIITTRLVKQKSPERQMAMYAEPPRREWQSLSDAEVQAIHQSLCNTVGSDYRTVARAIEAKLKEKNHE
jgi:hypothetical protein